jgi:hypothetical protein
MARFKANSRNTKASQRVSKESKHSISSISNSAQIDYTTLPGWIAGSFAFLLTFSKIDSRFLSLSSFATSSGFIDCSCFCLTLCKTQKLYRKNKPPAIPTHDPVTMAVIFAVILQTPFCAVYTFTTVVRRPATELSVAGLDER